MEGPMGSHGGLARSTPEADARVPGRKQALALKFSKKARCALRETGVFSPEKK